MISSRAARQFTEEDFVQDGVREVLAISAVSRRGGSQGLKIDRAEEGCMRREGVVIGRVQGTKSLNGVEAVGEANAKASARAMARLSSPACTRARTSRARRSSSASCRMRRAAAGTASSGAQLPVMKA